MTAIRIRHRGIVYRLFRFSQTGDWSLVIAWDRQQLVDPQHQRFSSDNPTPVQVAPPIAQKRLTYHTSGQVNYHGWIQSPPRYHEPPHAITRPQLLIGVSLAGATRLTRLAQEKMDNSCIVDLADAVGDARFTLGLIAAPISLESPPNTIFRLDYDVFSIVCITMPPPCIPSELVHHNIYFAPDGPLPSRAIDNLDVAMLAYHQARIGHRELGIYPPNGEGVYHLLPSVVMRAVPKVHVSFSEPGYRIEIVQERVRPMLIPFRIFHGKQRITNGDLRNLIVGVELDAEL